MPPPRSFIFCEKRFLCGSFAVDQDLFCRTVILHLQCLDRLLDPRNKMV